MHKEEEFSIKHRSRVFKDEYITLNNLGFIGCTFKNCKLLLVNDPEDIVLLTNCKLLDCAFIGDGWNYDLIEAMHEAAKTGAPLNWSGPIGNRGTTKH